MTRLIRRLAPICLAATMSAAPAAGPQEVDPNLVSALRQAVEDQSSFDDSLDALMWLSEMSKRLKPVISDPFYRVSLLKSIHAEATRAELPPSLVLAVIQVESSFDRFAVSQAGARGLMQVMPFWKKEIGHPGDDLFYPPTNLRYGCTILRYYLERFDDDLAPALAQYNGSLGMGTDYASRVLNAYRARWHSDKMSGQQ